MSIEELFEQIEDQPIEGGCDRCNAVQVVRMAEPGIFTMLVVHDDWCPVVDVEAPIQPLSRQ